MSLPLHESRVLALIEIGLCREDRELAERFAMFNRLAGPPPGARARPGRPLWWTLTAVALVATLILAFVATVLTALS